MHALPFTDFSGGDGSWTVRALDGDWGSFVFLPFFSDGFRLHSGEANGPSFLRLFFVVDLGASGDVDMSRSGSLNTWATSTCSFLLRFLSLLVVPFVSTGVGAGGAV